MTSSSLFGLALMGKDFHLEAALRAGLDAVSVVPENAQRHSLHVDLSVEVSIDLST